MTEGVQNGVGSELNERNTSKKNDGENRGGGGRTEREGDKEKKKRKENDGFFTSGFEWSLYLKGDFLKF